MKQEFSNPSLLWSNRGDNTNLFPFTHCDYTSRTNNTHKAANIVTLTVAIKLNSCSDLIAACGSESLKPVTFNSEHQPPLAAPLSLINTSSNHTKRHSLTHNEFSISFAVSGACAPTRKPLEYNLSGRTWCFNHTGESKAQLGLGLDQPGRGKNHHILIITAVPSDRFSMAGDRTSIPLWNRPKRFGSTEFQIKPRLSVPSFGTFRLIT